MRTKLENEKLKTMYMRLEEEREKRERRKMKQLQKVADLEEINERKKNRLLNTISLKKNKAQEIYQIQQLGKKMVLEEKKEREKFAHLKLFDSKYVLVALISRKNTKDSEQLIRHFLNQIEDNFLDKQVKERKDKEMEKKY
jgi:hypothetical protein